MSSKEIFALRKQGNSTQALAMARDEYPNNHNDIWFVRAYTWCLFDHAKKIVVDYENGILPAFQLSNQLSPYMQEFSRIGSVLKGDMCFSQMLNLANKASKDWSDFLYFAHWAGLDCFSNDDRQPYITENGDKIDSLQSRYLRSIVRKISTSQNLSPEIFNFGKEALKSALNINPNDQWLYYYQSKMDLNNGNIDLAIKSLMPVIHRQPRTYWVWGLLASILDVNQPKNALVCYIYASQLARDEQELAKIRITLAEKLAQNHRFSEASFQVKKALEYRQSHNFRIPDELQVLQNTQWYQQSLQENTIKKSDDVKELAQEILMGLDSDNIIIQKGILDHHNTNKKLAYIITDSDNGFAMFYDKFPDIEKLPIGNIIELNYSKFNTKKPLSFKVSSHQEIKDFCQLFTGELTKITDKNFAFIKSGNDSIFVPPNFAEGYQADTIYKVQCKAIKGKNKQGKIGWRAVEISNLE